MLDCLIAARDYIYVANNGVWLRPINTFSKANMLIHTFNSCWRALSDWVNP